MDWKKVRRLQYPARVDGFYFKGRADDKLAMLGYKERRREYYLSTDLALLYDGCIECVRLLSQFADARRRDADELAKAVSLLRVTLDDIRHHARSSAPSLARLQDHIFELTP